MTQTVLPSEDCPQGVREAPLFKSRTVSEPQTMRRWKREWIILSRDVWRGFTEAGIMSYSSLCPRYLHRADTVAVQ